MWNRHSQEEHEIISQQVQEMLNCGVIKKCYSPWASNVGLTKKRDAPWRFCSDFRALNKVTKVISYPIPKISDVLDSFSGSGYFSPLDFLNGFWQIKMCESDGSDFLDKFHYA
jgi:hypothetical protein